MLTQRDDELVGASTRLDAMGVLAIWSERGRNLVPHLTEQTTKVRGFQILVEAFRLWELYEQTYSEHADRLDDFFILIEQAFARTIGWHDKEWDLPGARRVRARSSEGPQISLNDPNWHLLGNQKANGLWGLYRGASKRARLLQEDMTRLFDPTMKEANLNPGIEGAAKESLFSAVCNAMDGATVELPKHGNNKLTNALLETYRNVPLADHLHALLIEGHELNRKLAERLLEVEELDHRSFLASAARNLPDHEITIENAISCEDLLSVVEAVFLWLCASKGEAVKAAVADLPVDLGKLRSAHDAFRRSGDYPVGTARMRHELFTKIDPSSSVKLARSVLLVHKEVCKVRGRAAWVWEDEQKGVLSSDVEVERPSPDEFKVGVAWRNDYYLRPLASIAKQLAKVRRCPS